MSERNNMQESTTPLRDVEQLLTYLKLSFIAAQYAELAQQAVQKEWSHVDYLVKDKANLIFLGGVGLGKTHLATALGYTACLQGYSVLFASAIDVINTLTAAKSAGHLKTELKKYTKPALLILDELGYLPIDKAGADLLFQVISLRYEQGAIVIIESRLQGMAQDL
jgi:DNA replication protein DnaC